MATAAGTRIGPYEIVAPLGAGGMGEVYRARDPRLGRDVAIKALPAAFAQDPERLARFEREARLLASLSHPNIAGIHGLEEAQGARFLALELVEGETLAARLARGPLPLDEALDVARQIAAGVEAAHENGVVHRDLKPGNVMIATSGVVKVLDFGLAKSGGAEAASNPGLSASPTMTHAATQAGMILGTAAYMSPEQARGRAVDKRTDVWSFGCVLYECLTGQQAFAGETVSDIVARILQTEPDWSALPTATPARLRTLLARCLEKDARRRLRDVGEARIEIEDMIAARTSASGSRRAPAAVATGGGAASWPWRTIAVTAAVVAVAAWFAPRLLVHGAPPPAARFEIASPKGMKLAGDGAVVSISPDGRMLAMIATDSSGTPSLWVRRLEALEPRRLPGTDGVTQMFWSPDSRQLGFFSNDQTLSRVAVDAGTPERICDTKAARGGTWGRDNTILFAPYSNGGIFRIPAGGGTPVQVTHPDSAHGVTGHRFPVLLPDGKHFLFVSVPAGPDGMGGLCVGTVDGGPTREIARVIAGVVWAPPGWLIGTRNGSLVAWRFDAGAMRLGEPVVIGDALVASQYSGGPVVSASRTGTLVYLTREDIADRAVWFDVARERDDGAIPIAPGLYRSITIAPDGHRALLGEQADPTRSDLVIADLDRGVRSRLTQSPENAPNGAWSKDGTRVAYIDETTETLRIRSLADGSMQTFLADDHAYKRAFAWTPDSREVLYGRLDAVTKWDLWLLPVGGGAPRPCLRSPANETSGGISPDGRWLSYQSDESGVPEDFVAPFMSPGLRYQVTIGGGGGGFSHDGKRYYFGTAKDPNLVQVAAIRTEPSFSLGPSSIAVRLPEDTNGWDLAPDERRIVRLVSVEKPAPQPATILQNWTSAARR